MLARRRDQAGAETDTGKLLEDPLSELLAVVLLQDGEDLIGLIALNAGLESGADGGVVSADNAVAPAMTSTTKAEP